MNAWLIRVQNGPTASWYFAGILGTYGLLWAGIAGATGFITSFFWKGTEHKSNNGVACVVLTWLPSLALGVFAVYLTVPFLVFRFVYIFAIMKGLDFWSSNLSRQFVGDFSEVDVE